MTRASDRFEQEARSEVRAKLLAQGIPAAHIDQVVDLGFHAADRAAATLQDILFSAGDERVSITAMGVAIGIAQSRLSALQSAMINLADEMGGCVKHFTVGGQANG